MTGPRFRAWDGYTSRYWHFGLRDITTYYEDDVTIITTGDLGLVVEPDTPIEQCTDMTDNRNVEIYQGDILRWEWLTVRVGIVEFRNYTDDDGGVHRGWVVGEDVPLPQVVAGRGGCVIIGNTHETPKDEKGYPL